MNEKTTLNSGQKHFLRLILKGRKNGKWASASKRLIPVIRDLVPTALVVVEEGYNKEGHSDNGESGGGRVRLTQEGEKVAWVINEWM